MLRILTPSRLHFGLPAPAASAGRRFGGVGLMIDKPGIELTFEPADAWSVRGPLAERGQIFLKHLLDTYLGTQVEPHTIRILHAAPEHMGLGTGTQLGLAIARGLAELADATDKSAIDLAPLVGRGLRSAIGIHGFDHGGFLVDGGRIEQDELAPLITWLTFPEEWRIVLIMPEKDQGVHGMAERQAFEKLKEQLGATESLCRRLVLELLPALSESNLDAFVEALYQFNRAAGEVFADIQGGPYANVRVASLIERLRSAGVRGVGQSSWGPTVFAIAGGQQQLTTITELVNGELARDRYRCIVTSASSKGAKVQASLPRERGERASG